MKHSILLMSALAIGFSASAQVSLYKDGKAIYVYEQMLDSIVFGLPRGYNESHGGSGEDAQGQTGEQDSEQETQQEEYKDPFIYDGALQPKEAPNGYTSACWGAQGQVITENYNGINGYNSLKVYLPVGYDKNKKYNILYLMHGGGEDQNKILGSDDDCQLQNILDHMIQNGELEPMIVVTPTFNKCEAQTFYKEFRQSVIPFVEGKYSTYAASTSDEDIKASRRHRAYGGFSMGGVSTWAVMQNCLDIVAYYMPLSGDHWIGNSADEKARNLSNAVKQSGFSTHDYFIFCATGSEDIAYPNVAPQIEAMKNYPEFIYTSDFSKGNLYFLVSPGKTHWWGYVRHYVYQALPYFFHE